MSVPASRLQEQNETAQLAAHFNEFYLQTTLPSISQIGNYRIMQEVGKGAFGKVYLAEHVLLRCQVVLKCGLLEDPNIVREIYYHKELRHRNIVKLYEVIKTETHLWMVLEYCEGSELYYHIYEKCRLDAASCKNIFYQIVEAIRYVHSLNLSHRDLKLENILMADEEKTMVKLTDFGFVREFNPYKRSLLATMCGTTSYMAPEVLKSEKYSGFAIDVWSMGVILYAMVYGQLPFDEDDDAKTKVKIVNDEPVYEDSISLDINLLLQQMLSKDPAKRPTVSEILNSPFLIDVTNAKMQRRSSTVTDSDSFVSMNQYYNVHSMPFQLRMEKDLVKKLRKGNIDIESLVASKMNAQANALTAFYDLSLKCEFEKQKRRNVRRKRYYEAKKQLKKSKKRVKNVLSLADQAANGPPLEKTLTSLSVASNRNDYSPSVSNMTRRSSDNFTKGSTTQLNRRVSFTRGNVTKNELEAPNGNGVLMPLERSVSFYTDERKDPNISPELAPSKAKSKQILEKLQFWKKIKRASGDPTLMDASSSSNSRLSADPPLGKSDDGVPEINVTMSPRKAETAPSQDPETLILKSAEPQSHESLAKVDAPRENVDSGAPSEPNGHHSHITPEGAKSKRSDSVVSQFSQFSQASQVSQTSHLYTMSESELYMMDGTDLDDDYYDDDAAYDSSISVSQQDLHHRPVSFASSTSRSKRRPANFRIPSDTLILSSSTGHTRRKNMLLQVSSNSSDDESSAILKIADAAEELGYDSSPTTRPLSPRQDLGRGLLAKGRTGRPLAAKHLLSNGSVVVSSPISPPSKDGSPARSASPPIGANKLAYKVRPNAARSDSTGAKGKAFLKLPAADPYAWRRDSPICNNPSTNVFERKFISINEEEEEEEGTKHE